MLLKLQLHGGLDAVAGVLVGLLQRQLHQVFVVRSCQVPADEDDDVGQDLPPRRRPHIHTPKGEKKASIKKVGRFLIATRAASVAQSAFPIGSLTKSLSLLKMQAVCP